MRVSLLYLFLLVVAFFGVGCDVGPIAANVSLPTDTTVVPSFQDHSDLTVFVNVRDGWNDQILVAPLNQPEHRIPVVEGCRPHRPRLSPDKRKIVYLDCHSYVQIQYLYSGQTRRVIDYPNEYGLRAQKVEWSTDGTKLFYSRNGGQGDGQLFVYDIREHITHSSSELFTSLISVMSADSLLVVAKGPWRGSLYPRILNWRTREVEDIFERTFYYPTNDVRRFRYLSYIRWDSTASVFVGMMSYTDEADSNRLVVLSREGEILFEYKVPNASDRTPVLLDSETIMVERWFDRRPYLVSLDLVSGETSIWIQHQLLTGSLGTLDFDY